MESELTILAIELAFGLSILANLLIPIACWFWVRRERRVAFRIGREQGNDEGLNRWRNIIPTYMHDWVVDAAIRAARSARAAKKVSK